ncbi:MAG TPA: hypothetical protein VFR27_08270 [Mycobacterium sp.]|nr:hypothetical protein [Mycobacterium sp.]
MTTGAGGKHRQQRHTERRHRDAAVRAVAPAPEQQSSQRPMLRAGALGGLVFIGAGNLTPVGAAGHLFAPPETVYRDDIKLADFTGTTSPTPTFDDSLHYLLDDLLKVGTKTLPQLLTAADPTLTVGQLLGMSSNGATTVGTSLDLTSLMYLLGLNNVTVEDVMDALNLQPTKTVDQILQQMNLANVDLDQILTPLGIPSTQTLYGLADRLSVVNLTLAQIMAKLGPITSPTTQSVQSALQSIGLGSFYSGWFTGCSIFSPGLCYICSGVTGTVEDALECIKTEYANTTTTGKPPTPTSPQNFTLNSNQTVGYLLTHIYQLTGQGTGGTSSKPDANFSLPVGNYTIGQALGFNHSTTVQQFVDNLQVNMGVTAGQWQNGIVNGSPSGDPVVTFINDPTHGGPTVPWGLPGGTVSHGGVGDPTGSTGTGTIQYPTTGTAVGPAPSDDDAGPGLAPTVSLGSSLWGNVLSWFNAPPNETLASLISQLWVNDVQLGNYTVGDAMEGMVVNPGAIGNVAVSDSTLVSDFLTAIGFSNMTLDQLIGLN